MNIVVHPEAEDELRRAADWYDDQEPGLGEELEEDVLLAFDLIRDTPEAWEAWPDLPEVRTFPMDRFPYLIPYVRLGENLLVLAVAHAKRRPGYWMARLPR